ncbi:hypothetical protein EJD97_015955, partial [Solanum chilense]
MSPVKRKLYIDTFDQTKIQKKVRSKITRKRNEDTTLIENLTTEAVSSSQAEVEFFQKEYEQRKVVEEEEDRKQEGFEEQGKINKVQEEEGENTEVVVVEQQAFKNYVWGHESLYLTINYMLRPLVEKISNLFGFPWAFMTSHVLQHVSHVATDDSSVATFVTHVATDNSSIATDNSC